MTVFFGPDCFCRNGCGRHRSFFLVSSGGARVASLLLVYIIDDFAKSPISALRTIFEESHVRLSTLNSSEIARALILSRHGVIQSRLSTTFYKRIITSDLKKIFF